MMTQRMGVKRFAELYESHNQGSGSGRKISWNGKVGHFTISRTQFMVDMFLEIRRKLVQFFDYDQFKEYSIDFLNIYTEYSEATRIQKFDHIGADDCFHSYMYARIAAGLTRGDYNKYLLGAENNPNHTVVREMA